MTKTSVLRQAFPLRHGLLWLAPVLLAVGWSGGAPLPDDPQLQFSFWIFSCAAGCVLSLHALGYLMEDHDRSAIAACVVGVTCGGVAGKLSAGDSYPVLSTVFWAALYGYWAYTRLQESGIRPSLESAGANGDHS